MKWRKRFFWLLLLFLPTQLGFHFWPEWAMVLGRRVDYLSPTLYLTDILVFFTVGTYIIFYRPWPRSAFFLTLLLFAVVNIFVATNPMVALYKWMKVTEFLLLGWYIVRTKPKLSAIIFPLSIGILYSSVLAASQFFFQHSVGGPLWLLGERTFSVDTPGIARIALRGRELLRPYGTFPHPNVLGGFLATVLPLILMSLMSPMGRMGQMKKRVYAAAFVAGVVALLLTFSRSAIVVGAIAMMVTVFRKRPTVLVLGAVLVLLITYHLSPITFSEESVVIRQQLNAAAMNLWSASPLFGVGLGNFLVRLPEALPIRTIYFLQPVHNIYLLLISEIGVVGVVGAVWLVWKAIARKKSHYPCILHSLFSILLLGLVDHYPLSLQQGQLLLTVLAAMSITSVH